ncbi:hypothetical protein BC940DRAFT_299250 [Gongronella butleri]|nr:hypothetical protein BC940DRAFT_299250 [Gongronella butleri]
MTDETMQVKPEHVDASNQRSRTSSERRAESYPAASAPPVNGRPVPGSSEWTAMRKENHKNVERRRREMINVSLKHLMDVIPGNEKNKSRVIGRAVEHIESLTKERNQLRKDLDHYQAMCARYEREITELKSNGPATPTPTSRSS